MHKKHAIDNFNFNRYFACLILHSGCQPNLYTKSEMAIEINRFMIIE